MDIRELFLKQKQAVYQGTVDVLAKAPADQIAWRPAEGMLSLGEVVRHLWTSEEGVRKAAIDGSWEYYEKRIPQGLFAILGKVGLLEEELAQIERVNRETLAAVEAFPLDRWAETRVNEALKINRKAGVMLYGIIEHQIHHRAQVGTYLRILTGKRASPYAI
jgi:uncharacterized damage-inducible protein DinB